MVKRQRGSRSATPSAAARRPRQRGAEQRRLPLRAAVVGVVVIAVVGFIGLVFTRSLSARDYSCSSLLTPPPDAPAPDGFPTGTLGAQHVRPGTTIRYGFCPPTSGEHYSGPGLGPLRPGVYQPTDDVEPGGWVHNLEHGFVVALYRAGDEGGPPAADLGALQAFAEAAPSTASAAACGYRSKVIVARFDDMATPYALVAWERALLLDRFDPSVALEFARRWIEASAPEPGAC